MLPSDLPNQPSKPINPKQSASDRTQELMLIVNDNLQHLNKRWLYALGLAVILSVPVFFGARYGFFKLFISNYHPPEIVYQPVTKEPIRVIEKKIFELSDSSYSGYVRLRNINLEWGVPEQSYTAEFRTFSGTLITKVEGRTFVLPSSDKIIVFARFTAEQKPENLIVTLGESKFNLKPASLPQINLDVQRTSIENKSSEIRVSSAVKNNSAFGVKKVGLPAVMYNSKNEVIGVNYTSVNDLKSSETRTFEYFWPQSLPAARVEISPEANIFDKSLLMVESGGPSF